jgi:hypothetical protein
LEYAREQTDLVLNKLADMLKHDNVDREMLDKLGWTEDDLQRFLERWQARKQAARGPDQRAGQELDRALRSLGLKPRTQQGVTQRTDDNLRDLRQGTRVPVPLEFRDRLRLYNQGVSRSREPSGE